MQDSQDSIDVTAHIKEKRKIVSLARNPAEAVLRLQECDKEDFILMEWILLNGMKLVFHVPVNKINTFIKEECDAAIIL